MNSQGDAQTVAVLMAFAVVMALVYVSLLLTVILLASLALFVIGWYLTFILLTRLDQAAGERLTAEHSGALLICSGGLWALVFWLFTPPAWVMLLVTLIPRLAPYPYFPAIMGGVLGLAWGMLVLFVADREQQAQLQDPSGMYSLTDQQLHAGDPETLDILADGVILGADIDV